MPRFAEIEDFLIDDLVKGIPGGVAPFRLGDIASKGWNILREDLPLPVAVLKASAIDNNGRWMRAFLDAFDAMISPHGKTTMSPQIFKLQLENGAWAITVSTVHHMQVCRRFGFNRILMANQLVGRQAIRYVLDELRKNDDFEFFCLADSFEGIEALSNAVTEEPLGRPINLLLEGGVEGARAGCRDVDTALEVARAIKASEPHLMLRGIEGYEGVIYGKVAEDRESRVTQFIDFLVEIAEACAHEKLFSKPPVILSAGGSSYYDIVVDRFAKARLDCESMVLTRSGGYLFHDSIMYRRHFERMQERSTKIKEMDGGLIPAIQVWSYVQSCPQPERIVLAVGKRDISFDDDLPVAELWYRPGVHDQPQSVCDDCRTVEMHTQHLHMDAPIDHPFRIGDMISLGISQPCTTFDKWQVIPVVDDDYNVVSAIRTFF